jgi:hypothetical protein
MRFRRGRRDDGIAVLEFSSGGWRKGTERKHAEDAKRRRESDLCGEGRRTWTTSRGGSYAGRAVATPGVR